MGIGKTLLIVGGAGIGMYLGYRWLIKPKLDAAANNGFTDGIPRTKEGAMIITPDKGSGIVPSPKVEQTPTWVTDLLKSLPGKAEEFIVGTTTNKAGVTTVKLTPEPVIVESKPGKIQKKVGTKLSTPKETEIDAMMPKFIAYKGQTIVTPNYTGKTGTDKLDAQQDLAEIGMAKGWIQTAGGTDAAPKWTITGAKTKLTRATAAKYVKAKLVIEEQATQVARAATGAMGNYYV